ncbi:MAG: lamin tail domain-containing protein, partial [Pseudomonadota bacterium]
MSAFINEFHYDDAGADEGEFIEIAGPAGTDLTGWSLVLYNGNGGAPYDTIALSGVLSDAGQGFGFLSVAATGLQNGGPDGIALVDDAGAVAEFLSYEGSFAAVGGPADGMTSTDIGVAEPGATPEGQSLQRVGTGTQAADFAFAGPAAQSPGAVNAGQSFGGEPAAPSLVISEIMYNPDSAEDDWEWIEVANTGAAAIDLAGWVLDDGNSVFHEAATIAAGSIAAGESAVLFNADDLTAEAFAAAWGEGLNLIAVADWSANTLNNGGDVIALWDSFEGYSTDIAGEAIAFDEAVAVVAYDDGGDWPADDGDASIYLTDLAADPNDGANWALSTVGDATPTGVGRDSVPDAASGNEGDVGSPGGDPVADPGSIEIVINEILADPAADLPGDANGDGTRDATQDEFVEIVNAGAAPADLSGFTLSDGVQARHVFPEGSVIAPGEALVVFGGGTPSGEFGGATVQLASTGALGLNNGGDTITIAAGDGTVVA